MTKPARYLDPFGDPVEAVRWTPDDPLAIGTCIGWLMSSGADFHHPDGAGGTTTLAVRGVNGRPDVTAQPGDWVVGRRPPLGRLRFAVIADDVFGKMFTADEAAYRGAVPSEAGRATPARRDFSKGWKPGPLPEDLAALAPDDPLDPGNPPGPIEIEARGMHATELRIVCRGITDRQILDAWDGMARDARQFRLDVAKWQILARHADVAEAAGGDVRFEFATDDQPASADTAVERLEAHHRRGRERTDDERAALEARALACATEDDLRRAAREVAFTPGWLRRQVTESIATLDSLPASMRKALDHGVTR